MNFDDDEGQRYLPNPVSQKSAAPNSSYFLDAIPGVNATNGADGMVDNLDVVDMEPEFYQNPHFEDINGGEDILGIGNIGNSNQRRGPASLSSMQEGKSDGEMSDEDADVFKQ